ncbi:MAG: ribbon-helix-helix protein, CopG family [Planctomycetes bacterium]|nr:ribbon-helix-helix protein, CopG family [Planctomycetota bacterium]
MVRTEIQWTDFQAEAVRKEAIERGVSMAELIRQSLDSFLNRGVITDTEERRRRAIAVAGKFRSGSRDLAVRHEAHLSEAHPK